MFIYRFCCLYQPSGYHTAVCYQLFGSAQYIINDAQIRFLFVGEQFQYDAAFSAFGFCHSLEKLIIFDRSVVRDPRDKTSIYYDEFLALGEGLPHNALWKSVLPVHRTATLPIFFIHPAPPASRKE